MDSTLSLLDNSHLVYITDTSPGITRERTESGFMFKDSKGIIIEDEKTLQRIKSLGLPPAWENVWISPKPRGYLQATGIDAKKRKQYRYHNDWIELSQNTKFDKLLDFVSILPDIRQQLEIDMQKTGLSYEKVLATTIWLLENTLIRIGNDTYAKQNKSFGLTTIQNKHVEVHGSKITFAFKGKSGVYHEVEITNKKVARVLKQCQELPEQELLEYIDTTGKRCDITSNDVNSYLKQITGKEITAKDFRTWGGTTTAAQLFDQKGVYETQTELKKTVTETIKNVALHLRNKPATCKKYYIHPSIIDAYSQKYILSNLQTIPEFTSPQGIRFLDKSEELTAELIKLFQNRK